MENYKKLRTKLSLSSIPFEKEIVNNALDKLFITYINYCVDRQLNWKDTKSIKRFNEEKLSNYSFNDYKTIIDNDYYMNILSAWSYRYNFANDIFMLDSYIENLTKAVYDSMFDFVYYVETIILKRKLLY